LFSALKEWNWVAIIGWMIFFALFVALLTGNYIFNPFTVGFAYYVVYALKNTLTQEEDDDDKFKHRFIFVCIIALFYLYNSFRHEDNRRQFIRSFESRCYSRQSYATTEKMQLCEEIASDIETYLYSSDQNDDYFNQ